MIGWIEALTACFLLTSVMLAASSRLLHCIRIAAVQGIILGVLPLLMRGGGLPDGGQLFMSFINILLKGAVLPTLLWYALRRAGVRRELEPFIGYAASLFTVLACIGLSFWLAAKLPLPGAGMRMVTPVAFSTMLTGLFLVMARKKAITQAIGFLTFENGIALFGTGMMLECGLAVELGILLDVFVLVFIMGIALQGISREFAHIDSDRMHELDEKPVAPMTGGGEMLS